MKKTLNRKQFLGIGVSAAAVGLVGCASDDGGDGTMGTGGAANGTGGAGTGGAGTGGAGTGGESMSSGGSGSGGEETGSGGEAPGTGGDDGGTGGDAAGTGGESGQACAMVTAEDQGPNHVHAVTVPPEDVAMGVEKTYLLEEAQGLSLHTHMLTVTAENFTTLKADGTVAVLSSNDDNHTHEVVITCA